MKDNNEYFKKWYLHLTLDDKRIGAEQTKKETDFIKSVLNLKKGSKILDLCCGHGRHAVLLANDFDVTGQDLDQNALNMLSDTATKEKVRIKTICSDMRIIPNINEFEAVIMMYSSFGYFSDDEENEKVMKSVNKSLKPGGLFLFDIRNKNLTLKYSTQKTWEEKNDSFRLYNSSFDEKTNLAVMNITIIQKGSNVVEKTSFILKLYSLEQIKAMLEKNGFKLIKVFGDTTLAKEFNPETSKRMVFLAKKGSL
ncbi:MAG: class I SAM-dependent methyltransferase [Candidatus Paceibacterota bacterium]|jgi:ubiquinone/menaquinone biosynthesis C-methylase UbiE